MSQISADPETSASLFASAQASTRFALACLEPAPTAGLRSRSSFVDPTGQAMHWHDFGDLEGPGWAANALGGALLLYRWGRYLKDAGVETRQKAIQLVDHILEDGFVRPDGLIWPYWDLARSRFCLNYTHTDAWLCPGSLALIGIQLIELADLMGEDEGSSARAARLRQVANGLSAWLEAHVPLLANGWVPRRITLEGQAYPLSPNGGPDAIFDHSADGLYLLALWALTGHKDLARQAGDAFVAAGGFWGSINHDTFDDHENVAYAVAFRLLRRVAGSLDRPAWREFCYTAVLPAMRRFRMGEHEHGVMTRGLFWMEQSWDTAYLWENAEVAQAHLEAWLEQGDVQAGEIALGILRAIAVHHYGPHGFLTEGVDWNNHVSQRHHIGFDYYGAIRYTEPLLNNLHLVLPTLTYLRQAADFQPDSDLLEGAGMESSLAQARRKLAAGLPPAPDRARYLLRLFYPVLETDASVEAVLAFIREAGIDGVLLFESNYDTDPALLRLDVLEQRFARLKTLVPRFQAAGLEVHINVEITMGHVDAGGAHPEWFNFQWMVTESGGISRSTPCPLDPVFLDYAAQIYRWAAGCGASAVWVDDDVRMVYHDLPGMNCFCPHHLEAMAQRTGRAWDRASLAAALADDRQADVRRAWFDLQEGAMLGLARRVEAEIHAIDPHIQIGLMSIGSNIHAGEGRFTDRLLRTLAGEGVSSGPKARPMLRPGSGFWNDWEPGAVLMKTEDVFRQISFLGRDVRTVAEIENHPYSAYQKSERVLGLELALEVLAGTLELSLNILNSTMPYRHEPGGKRAANLRRWRPFLDQLARERAGKLRLGIGVEASESVARKMPLRGRPLSAWIEPRPWELVLGRLGLPVGQPQSAPHLLTGEVVHTIDHAALESLLLTGAVLTPSAVTGLLELGWGERIGVSGVTPAAPGGNEVFTGDELNGAQAGMILQVRHYASVHGPHRFSLIPGVPARILSTWRDVSGADLGPAVVALELPGGGRLGLLPFEIQSVSPQVLQLARRDQWAALFEWVCREPIICRVTSGENVYPQVFAAGELGGSETGGVLLALANLSADDQNVTLRGPILAGATTCERLLETGAWILQGDPTHLDVAAWSLTVLRLA